MDGVNSDAYSSRRGAFIGPLLPAGSTWPRYGVAIALPLATGLVRLILVPALGSGSPLLPFYFTTLLVAILAGRAPATLAASISIPCAAVIALTGYDQLLSWAWAAHLGLFLCTATFMIALVDSAQRSHVEQRELLYASRASEQLARRTIEQMRLIADAMPALIAYIDNTYTYRFNNQQYQEWFGRSVQQLSGRPVHEVLGDEASNVLLSRLQQSMEGALVHFEATVPYRAAGERYVSVHYVPDRDTDGTIRGVFALIEDISDRKRAADTLQHTLQKLSLAQRAGRTGTYEWDIGSNVATWSEELLALHGFGPGEFGGTHEAWLASIHPEDRQRMTEQTACTLVEGKMLVEYRIVRHDTGEVRWMQGRGRVYYSEDGTPLRLLGVNVDITERVEAEAALRREAQRKDEFLAMLAHELRNPLAPIRSAAALLRQCAGDPPQVQWIGDMLDRQSGLLTRMVDDLLDVGRITHGLIELRRSIVNVELPINAALESIQPIVDRKQQSIQVQRSTTPLLVDADSARLSQVFSNLLINASKYSPEHSRIRLSIEHDAEYAIVRVCDEGEGIEEQLLPHVFDLFTQGKRSLARPQGGLGLGLTIVKHLINMHDGAVQAHSFGRGAGSEFIVKLRRVAGVSPPQVTHSLPASERQTTTIGQRVLIVDDNLDAARMLAMVLEIVGYDVRTVADGRGALESFDEFKPGFVLLDIGLPDLNGYEVARRLRQQQVNPVRIYALSGYGNPEDRQRAVEHGCDGHLTKPCNPDHILDLLSERSAVASAHTADSTLQEARSMQLRQADQL